jgi:hypothetical protein
MSYKILNPLLDTLCPHCTQPHGKGFVKKVYPNTFLFHVEGEPDGTAYCKRCKQTFDAAKCKNVRPYPVPSRKRRRRRRRTPRRVKNLY